MIPANINTLAKEKEFRFKTFKMYLLLVKEQKIPFMSSYKNLIMCK